MARIQCKMCGGELDLPAKMISTGDFENAKNYLERLLDQNPENGWAYFNLLLAEMKLTDKKMLVNFPNIRLNSNFKLAEQFADDKLKELLNQIIHEQEKHRRLEADSKKRMDLLEKHIDLEAELNGLTELNRRLDKCISNERRLQSNPDVSDSELAEIVASSQAALAECGDFEVKKQLLEQKRKKQTKIILSVLGIIVLIIGIIMAVNSCRVEAERKARAEIEAARIEAERAQFEAQVKALGPEELTLPGGIKLEMVMIPSGSFQRERNIVTLTKPFYLGKYEVTQAQWKAVMGRNPSRFNGDNLPVECISWHDAKEFCKKLNEIYADKLPAGYQFDLPTEAQWEYACRAGTTTNYSYGDASDASKMNFDGNYSFGGGAKDIYRGRTVEVGSLGYKNAFGLYDMHGNVWEWCRDWYGSYPGGSVTDPVGPSSGSNRVFRGGSWYYYAYFCRSADRFSNVPSYRSNLSGFRLALVPIQ